MSRPIETIDIALLRSNKNEFIIRCQRVISIIVKKFIGDGIFIAADFEDITQNVNVELIRRLPLIEKNYNGDALLITYVSAVIRNICLRLNEHGSANTVSISIGDVWGISDENSDKGILISDELRRFHVAMKLFHSLQSKVSVCLKVYFSIPVTSGEARQCFRGISIEDHYRFVNFFEGRHIVPNNNEYFTMLAQMINKYEETFTTEESIRRWTNMMLQKLIDRMNGKPPKRAHTKESIKFLLEQYSELHYENE